VSRKKPWFRSRIKPLVTGWPWACALNLYELASYGTQGWWWRLHWTLWRRYRGLDPGEVVRSERGEDPGELSYGETPALTARAIFQLARLQPEQSILDLGSGRGLLLFVAAFCGFRATGIELVHEYVERSRKVAEDLSLAVSIEEGDFLDRPWGEPDLVTINSTAFGVAFRRRLAARLRELPEGTSIATFDWELNGEHFSLQNSGRLPVTWGTVVCRIYRVVIR